MAHIPVLCSEVCALFADLRGVIIDCTLGFGGHSAAILAQNPNIKVIGIDRDSETIEKAKANLAHFGERFVAHWGCFGDIAPLLQSHCVVGILADLGISSYHLDTPARGFGFRSETLDMRMDQNQILSAKKSSTATPKTNLKNLQTRRGARIQKTHTIDCQQAQTKAL